ncbi:MAG: DNA repair protein RadC [Methanolinea sp.]|nr:DNA repair protein RadC [Methanolinea sp.]
MKPMRDREAPDRPREKIAKRGPESLTDKELIAAVIGRGIPGRDVFEVAGEISTVLSSNPRDVTYQDLTRIRGVGPAIASQILAGLELARRHTKQEEEGKVKIQSPSDVLPLVAHLNGSKQEHFLCITLNGANEVITTRTITVGLLNHSLVHPREVFSDAITDRAAAVICVHNHPSGSLEPSSQDLAITRQLSQAGEIMGIRVLDHLIVAKTGFVSLREKGLL